MAHALFSPSAAHRWMLCPGSLDRETGERASSAYADEGTAAHEVAAMCLEQGQDAATFVGRRINISDTATVEVTAEMAESVQLYLDFCRGIPATLTLVEKRVFFGQDIGQPDDDASGTADFIAYDAHTKSLHVVDLKFGRGMPVSPVNNAQLLCYALGAYADLSVMWDIEHITVTISQPRIYPEPRSWDVTPEMLTEFASELGRCATVAAGEMAHPFDTRLLRPSDTACKWCPRKAECPALGKLAEQADTSKEIRIEHIKNADLAARLEMVGAVRSWCVAIEEEAIKRLKIGYVVPGWRLEAGREGHRQWLSSADARRFLTGEGGLPEDVAAPRQVVSPAVAGRLLAAAHKDNINALCVRNPATLKLARSYASDGVLEAEIAFTGDESAFAPALPALPPPPAKGRGRPKGAKGKKPPEPVQTDESAFLEADGDADTI